MENHEAFYESMAPNYIAMGRLLHAWDNVESGWSYFFETLFEDHPFSQRVFYASSTFATKANIIERLLEVSSSPARENTSRALDRSKVLARRRNDIVHGAWVSTHSSQVIRIAIKKDHDDTAATAAAYISNKDQKLADRAYDTTRMLKLSTEIQTLAEEVYAIAERLRGT